MGAEESGWGGESEIRWEGHLLLMWTSLPEGRPGMSVVFPPCLESQGCHLIPVSYLGLLSYHFSATGPLS